MKNLSDLGPWRHVWTDIGRSAGYLGRPPFIAAADDAARELVVRTLASTLREPTMWLGSEVVEALRVLDADDDIAFGVDDFKIACQSFLISRQHELRRERNYCSCTDRPPRDPSERPTETVVRFPTRRCPVGADISVVATWLVLTIIIFLSS